MSDASSSPASSSASGSPGDQILAEEEETRVDGVQEDDSNDISMETNEEDPTEDLDPLDSPLAVGSPSSQPELENEADPDPEAVVEAVVEVAPEADARETGAPEAESEHQPGPEPEVEVEVGTQPPAEQNNEETGTVGQPISINDDTSGEQNGAAAASDQVAPSTTPSQQAGTGILQLAQDAVTDGRVKKNPVPNKYVAKATKRDGNFGVMQMGHGRAFMDARDLAAKRSSEATQAAAEEAVRNGQNGMARRKHVWKPADPNMSAPPPPQPQPQQQFQQQYQQYAQYQQPGAYQYPQPGYYQPPPPPPPPGSGPSVKEVKDEQARLLTFLRSLHPVIVVDQLCKALAYFGGIPGAPAPADGIFPKSAQKNGSGGVMVGWLGEIFPPADFTKPPFSDFPHSLPNMGYVGPGGQAPGPAFDGNGSKDKSSDPNAPARRPRGRPKGSKNSKFRKDKGAKKLKPGDMPPHADGTPWRPGDGSATVDLTQDTNSSQPAQPADDAASQPAATQPSADAASAGVSQAEPDSSAVVTPGKKKRGRPKGSKTRTPAARAMNIPVGTGSPAFPPGPEESPLASVARAANDATSTQYESPYKAAPAQRKPSAQETTLSQHAQGWVDPPAPSPRDPLPDSAAESESAAQPTLPPPTRNGGPNQKSKAANVRKRKQQSHAPLAFPTPLPRGPPPPTQTEQAPPQNQLERHQLPETTDSNPSKRRRTANGVRPGSAASNTNSKSQSPALSTSIASSSATPTPASAGFGSHGASRAPPARPNSGQPLQQQYQPPPQQQQQFQNTGQSRSPPLNNAPPTGTQSRQGSYPQQPQQGYFPARPQQQYNQTSYQSNANSFGGTSGANSNQQFSYDNDYINPSNPNPYALSARRAVDDASNFGNQSMYGQYGRR